MRKIKNRATIFFLCIIIISNFLALYAGYGLKNDEASNINQGGILNLDGLMNLPNEQDVLALIKSPISSTLSKYHKSSLTLILTFTNPFLKSDLIISITIPRFL